MTPNLEALAILNKLFESKDGAPVDAATITRKHYGQLIELLAVSADVPRGMVLVCITCRFPVNDENVKACTSGEACPHKFGKSQWLENMNEKMRQANSPRE